MYGIYFNSTSKRKNKFWYLSGGMSTEEYECTVSDEAPTINESTEIARLSPPSTPSEEEKDDGVEVLAKYLEESRELQKEILQAVKVCAGLVVWWGKKLNKDKE